MAGVKNINVVSGTGNPVQMQDLQNLWSVINTMCTAKSNSVTVLAGMKTKTVGSETVFEAGIIFYQDQAYYLADGAAKPGQYLYVASQPSGQRIYEDGVTRYMYTDYMVNVSDSPTTTGIGTFIGQATTANVAMWQTSYIAPESITTALLQDNAVTTPKIADGAVTYQKLASQTIKDDNIEDQTIIGYMKIMDGTVTEQTIGSSSVGTLQLKDKSVTTDKIGDGSVTNNQIARATIEGNKLVPRTISDINIAEGGIVTDNIEDGAITTNKLFPGAVDSGILGLQSVATPNIANGAVTTEKIADNAVSVKNIMPGAVKTAQLAVEAVGYDEFKEGTIPRPRVIVGNVSDMQVNPTSGSTCFIATDMNRNSGFAVNLPTPIASPLSSAPQQVVIFMSDNDTTYSVTVSIRFNNVRITDIIMSAGVDGIMIICNVVNGSWRISHYVGTKSTPTI